MSMGNALKKARRTEEALARYEEAIALEPEHGLTYVNMASALADAGRAFLFASEDLAEQLGCGILTERT